MDRKRAETLWNLGDSLSVLNLYGAEVADLCAAWVELHKDKRLPAYPCPINEANEKIRELKEDAAKMMDELARLRAENERLTEALTHYQHPDTVAEISLRGKMPAFPIQLYCSACGSLVAYLWGTRRWWRVLPPLWGLGKHHRRLCGQNKDNGVAVFQHPRPQGGVMEQFRIIGFSDDLKVARVTSLPECGPRFSWTGRTVALTSTCTLNSGRSTDVR